MNEQQVNVELSEDQQIVELGRLAGECLENEVFQAVMEGVGTDLQADFNKLKPTDKEDFTVVAAKRELFNQIIGQFNGIKAHGEEVKKGLKADGGLIG